MNVIIDTHIFLWWITDNPKLSENARKTIANSKNRVFVSAASGLEISIKASIGRLTLPDSPEKFIPEQLRVNDFSQLPISLFHTLYTYTLPLRYPDASRPDNDQFDRILISQSILEKCRLLQKMQNSSSMMSLLSGRPGRFIFSNHANSSIPFMQEISFFISSTSEHSIERIPS